MALGPTQAPIKWIPVSFPEEERPGREVDPSHWYGAHGKNEWSYTSSPNQYPYGVDRAEICSKYQY
jgi:hypothetical protein